MVLKTLLRIRAFSSEKKGCLDNEMKDLQSDQSSLD